MNPAVWTAPAAVAAGLLFVAGTAKSVRPHDTARALATAGIAVSSNAVRAGAAVEAAVGLWALGTGHPTAYALVAASYAVFVVYLVAILARGLPVSSCGCLGEPDVPPTWTHVAVDLVALVAAVGASLGGAPSLVDEMARQPLGGLPYAVLVALGIVLASATISLLPRLGALAVERAR